jgi:two-component system, LytTR family, sensor kinase
MTKRFLLHLLFWLTYFVWGVYVMGSYDGNFSRSFLADVSQLPIKVASTYFIMYYLLPNYLATRQYKQLLFLLFLLIVVSSLIFRFTIYKVIQPYYYPDSEFHFWNFGKMLWGTFEIFSIAAIAVSIKLFKQKYASIEREQALQKEKLQAELSFLKAQINPHFLFNTLNNIYGLSLKNSPQTSDAILKLSELLQFMVHDGAAEKIKLTDEINMLKDYIELEKLRYGDRLKVNLEIDLDNENESIAPLLLIPFVENSFKHGASQSRFNSSISIVLKVKEGVLTFRVSNSKETQSENTDGIGLKNIRRQLELIYGKYHQLKILNLDDTFIINLTLQLKAHEATKLPHN